MPSRRVLKAAAAVREVVSMAILTDLNDPRVEHVTVTYVEMSPDMRQAKIHVSIMGDETKQRLSLAGLRSAAGYLQSKVAKGIDTRYTPRLEFVLDQGVKRSIQIAEILSRVLPKESGDAALDEDPTDEDPTDEDPTDEDPTDEDRIDEDRIDEDRIDDDLTDDHPADAEDTPDDARSEDEHEQS